MKLKTKFNFKCDSGDNREQKQIEILKKMKFKVNKK